MKRRGAEIELMEMALTEEDKRQLAGERAKAELRIERIKRRLLLVKRLRRARG